MADPDASQPPPAPAEPAEPLREQPPAPAATEPAPPAVVPGRRAARLQALYAQALEHTLSRLSYDNLSGCYPTVSARAEPVLRQVQAQMASKLGDKCRREFDAILDARGVVPRLNELESLVDDAKARRDAAEQPPHTPPHLAPPERILQAHQSSALSAHRSQLNARLQTSQAQNAALAEKMAAQRREMESLLSRVEAAAADVAGANAVLGPLADGIAAEARSGEAAVRAAAQQQQQQ